jgi:hypothetical protein
MVDVQEVTQKEAENNLPFMLAMCTRNRTVWRIVQEDGSVSLLSPMIQSGPPIDEEVMNQVEEFRKELLVDKEE